MKYPRPLGEKTWNEWVVEQVVISAAQRRWSHMRTVCQTDCCTSARQLSTFPVTSTEMERKRGWGLGETQRDGIVKQKHVGDQTRVAAKACWEASPGTETRERERLEEVRRDGGRETGSPAEEESAASSAGKWAAAAVRIMELRRRNFQMRSDDVAEKSFEKLMWSIQNADITPQSHMTPEKWVTL